MKQSKKLLFIIPIILLLAVLAFVAWVSDEAEPMPEAVQVLAPDDSVTAVEDEWITFRPTGVAPDTGLIFYPGGKVDPRAYVPAAKAIARQGYQVTIVPMPLNLAFFDADAALAVMAAYPDIEQWAVGGHSLGGSMAAKFAYDHPDEVAGLVLWAAYPAASNDLSNLDQLEAVSIYGSNDGLSTPTDIENTQNLLPPRVEMVEITGGNHAQFGWYGPQDRDNPADISRIEQQAQVVQATVDLLNRL